MGPGRAIGRWAVAIAAGLPLGFALTILPALLRAGGASLTTVGLAACTALPWWSRALWAPLVGARAARRAWTPVMLALAAGALAISGLVEAPAPLVAITATASTFAALATLGVDRGPAGSTLAGHELGRLLGGGVLFAIPAVSAALGATETSPATPLLASSALTAALAAITALAPRATVDVVEGRALTRELRDLASSKGGGALLTLMATFALGELLVVAALRPYAVDHGFAIADVAAALGVWSGLAAIAGASLGTVIARRGDALRVLGVAAALRIGPLFAAAVVAQAEPAPSSIVGIAVGAAFFGGVVLAAAAELVEATRRVHGAARADALVVVEGLGHGAAWVLAGVLADQHGHLGVFVLGAAAAVVFLWTLGSARRTTRDAT